MPTDDYAPHWSQDPAPTDADFAEAKRLIEAGFKQTSARYRSLARIPSGMTALEALRKATPDAAKRLEENFDQAAASQYLRGNVLNPEDRIEVSIGVFRAFKRLNGDVA